MTTSHQIQTTGHDPKRTAGSVKLPMAVLPWAVILELSAAMGEGAIKYDPHNWRESGGVCASTYLAGCFRHLIAYALGEDIDPDTLAPDGSGGVSHLTKLMASAAVLRDATLHGVAHDDRPPPSPPDLIQQLTAAYTGLVPGAREAREAMKGSQSNGA